MSTVPPLETRMLSLVHYLLNLRIPCPQIKNAQLNELNSENEVVQEDARDALHPAHLLRMRHNKMIHTQISRLAKTQDQLDLYQQNLQSQVLDVQRRLDRIGDANWNLLSAKVDFLDLETKVLRDHLKNTSQKVSDFDKVHASLLELREDIESIENKADKTIPEFRKEISKLDVSFAQVSVLFIRFTFVPPGPAQVEYHEQSFGPLGHHFLNFILTTK